MSARLVILARLAALLLFAASPVVATAADDNFFIVDVPKAQPEAATPSRGAPKPIPLPQPGPASSARSQQTPLKVTPIEGERPDESALRYYAALGQTERANVEIQRLVRLYPGWVPPVDLFDMDTSSQDEDAFWDLFSADRLTELRAAIEARKRDEPGWQPSKDLATKLRRKELRSRIVTFWKDGRWKDLVDFVKNDGVDDDTDVDLLWTVAEAYGRTKQVSDAVGIYRTILNTSQDTAARLATVQKAMAILRMADVEPLIAMARTRADGTNEFAPIMVDIVRQRISAYLHDERTATVPDAELALFQDYAKTAEDPNQPGLVAWYYYKTKAYRDALQWFKVALERGGDAMIAHGLAHSLRSLDMRRETEEVAYAWREPLVNNLILFVDILERDLTKENPPYIEPERLARYARVTMDVASGEGAQALAWYAYNSCQYPVALEWFQRAVAWFPKEATAYGYALTLKRLKRMKEFWEVVNRYDGLFPKVLEIVFPDKVYPIGPCDMQAQMQLRPAQQQVQMPGMPAYVVPGATPNMMAGYGDPRLQQQAVPGPTYSAIPMPKIDPKEFPIAIDPENPLRFAAAVSSMRAGMMNTPVFAPPAMRDLYRGPYPLVANRVPGVGPMPYERFGFALLPGYNGQAGPSSPTHSAQIAPAGSLWSSELTDKDRPRTAAPLSAIAAASQLPTSVPPSSLPTSVPVAPAPPVRDVTQQPLVIAPSNAAPSASAPPAQVAAAPVTGVPPAPVEVSYDAGPMRPVLPSTTDPAVLAQRAQQFYTDKAYSEALAALDQRAPLAPETNELRMIRGWSLLHLKRAEEARAVFANLGKRGSPAGSGSR